MTIYLTHYCTAATTQTTLLEDIAYPQSVHWFPDTYARKDTGLVYPPHKLADKVLDATILATLRKMPVKTAFILAAGNTHFAGINPRNTARTQLTYEYKVLPLTLTQVYAGRIAQMCDANDLVITDASACASSLKVLQTVQELITLYQFERVVVLTVEDAVSNAVLEFFGEAQASLSAKDQQSGILPSAFDDKNYGFFVGQGAALAVFETQPTAQPIAKLLGAYAASECSTNAIGQTKNGEGFIKAMQGAMRMSSILPTQIDVVKTHGTGTKSNNIAEDAALKTIMGNKFIATSYKQRIGHTMGASGLLESLLLMEDINKGFVPEIPNRTAHDDTYLSRPKEAIEKSIILSLAAGMGNIYAAAIFDTRV